MSLISSTPHSDRPIWKWPHELLSGGHYGLLLNHEARQEITRLLDMLRARLFLSADLYFLDLMWGLFSLFPSSLDDFRRFFIEIQHLEPIIHETDALGTCISNESSHLLVLRKKYDWANQTSVQLQSEMDNAIDICDFLLEFISERGGSSELESKLSPVELLVENLSDPLQERNQEIEGLARLIHIKTHRLAVLESQRAEFQCDLHYHSHLVTNVGTLEANLKVLVAKIEAYFHFM